MQFRLDGPSWAPDLPIDSDACQELENNASARMQCVGEYGTSLLISQWDPAHPAFDDYCRETGPGWYWHQDENVPKFRQFLRQANVGIAAAKERCRNAVEHMGGHW
jgi:hypothetical protein